MIDIYTVITNNINRNILFMLLSSDKNKQEPIRKLKMELYYMKKLSFLKAFFIMLLSSMLIIASVSPIIYSSVYDIMMELTLNKNREQAERLATLVSLDLERGKSTEAALAQIQAMLESTPQSDEHFACIVQHENRVIAHPKPSNVGKDVTGWILSDGIETKTYTQSAGEGLPFGGIQTRTNGTQDITFQVPISTQPWAVAVHTKLDLIGLYTQTILKNIAYFASVILFLLLLISAYLISNQKT